MGYVIMADTDSELDYRWTQENGVLSLLMPYIIHEKEYRYSPGQGVDLPAFFEELRKGVMPTTAGCNVIDFMELWEPALQRGDDVLYIGLSSALSNTLDTARLAAQEAEAKYPDRKIRVVDSLRISMAEGQLVRLAVELKKQGKSMEETADIVEASRMRSQAWFTVDDLNFLKRGGRLSGSAAFLGTILEVKPLLHINEDGKLVPVAKIKGRKKALRVLLEKLENADPSPDNIITIFHGDRLEDGENLARAVRERYGFKQVDVRFIGPVIGCHVGPGTMGITFMAKDESQNQ